MGIRLKRAYDPVAPEDGRRVLIDRLWPRGVTRARLRIDAWLRELAPSSGLRRWFAHDPAKCVEFRRRYLNSDMLAHVWGAEYRDDVDYLRTYIRTLRKKLEANPASPRLIVTKPGVGYMLAASEKQAAEKPKGA